MSTFMDFRVSTMKLGRRAYAITVAGELDLFTSTELQEALALLPGDVTRALVDLTRVTLIDAPGLGLLVRFAERLRARGGGVVLAVADDSIPSLLRQTKLERLFEIRRADEQPGRYLVGLSLLDSLPPESLARNGRGVGA